MTHHILKTTNLKGRRVSRSCADLPIATLLLSMMAMITIVSAIPMNNHWHMPSHDVISIQGDLTPMGHLLSPNYPRAAPVDEISIATLHVAANSTFDTILLKFEELDLQTANNCEGESVNIFLINERDYALDPNKLIYSFCGTFEPEPVLIFSRNLVIQYVSDEFVSNANSRFEIKFEFMNASRRLHDDCEQANQFKCRNRKCISSELLCNGFDDCGDASDEDRWTPCMGLPTIPYRTNYKCGIASFGKSLSTQGADLERLETLPMNRIIGGNAVRSRRNSLPQVSIQLIGIEPISHICGGSLIHPSFVLTSAHCFRNEMSTLSIKLLFGLQDLTRPHESQVQVRYAIHTSFYPSFGYKLPETIFNDLERANNLALIELNAPVHMNTHVWPACLPHLGETIAAGRECVLTGFGETRGSGETFALKQLKQTIVHSSECDSMFSDFSIDDYNMICIQNQNSSGACKGDSGGPLMCRNDDVDLQEPVNVSEPELESDDISRLIEPGEIIDYLTFDDGNSDGTTSTKHVPRDAQTRYTVHGVTSFTTDGNFGGGYCGFKESPTIYARVSNRVEWILTVLKLALPHLNKSDQQQDLNNKSTVFGYLFRSGFSQHPVYTPPMTEYKTNIT